ncbi:thiosulfate sulfurtransferase/rhodanese-like domain-containing protein 3 [Sapajus apella]|uniref:Sulfurtransferase n=1 Tax=Sapajus apella TaxID=9515 RepID=A0A6J3HJT0_SAPAP|nr:thiosulfate sulfurtransferase/rhodanese-like domain-containing protein 3 [Sapajus apella]
MPVAVTAGAWLEGAREPGAARLEGGAGAGGVGGSGQQRGGRQAMVLPWLLLGTARRAVLGSVEAALCGLKSIKGNHHNFYTAISKDVTYKELKNLLNSKNIMLIDVREAWEILEYGKIPGSINIPLDEVGEALQMNPRDFKEKYNEVKPSKSDNLVFSCLAGVRSKKALDTAISLGFHSAQHYAGGWKEWVTYEFSEKKQGN